MVGCGVRFVTYSQWGESWVVCGNRYKNLRSNKPYLCDECLKACSYSNDVKKTNYKPLKLHLKRLEDLPLIICSTTERITYRLCRLYCNGYYYKYVSFGLTASAWEDDILKVHSEENKRREIEEKRKAIKNERIRIENEILDFLKVRGVYN